jgi:hypothetical protein
MKFEVTEIEYDVDEQEDLEGLPTSLEIVVPDELSLYEDIEQFISDEISNKTGFCHKGFSTTPEIKTNTNN